MCSLNILCTWCTNCGPGARVCSSKGSCFKTTTFCTLCAHSCTLCTGVHKNIFDEHWHTYFFFAPNPTPSRRRQPDWWRQVAYTGTKLLYQPQPQPVVYIVPIQNILGRLALAPCGEHGTIPHEWHHLQGSHYPRGVCDSPNRSGSGSKLFYINSWAMIWSSDHPRVATKAK